MQALSVLAVGRFTAARARSVAEASAAAGREIEFLEPFHGVSTRKGSAPVAGVLVDGGAGGASGVVFDCRSDSEFASLPIIVLTDRVTDLGFSETFNSGADDIVNVDVPHALTKRLRILPVLPTPTPLPTRGAAIVAIADQTRRVVVGRVLRNAGYAVTFALDASEATRFAGELSAALVLLDSAMVQDPRAIIANAREASPGTVCILSATPRELSGLRAVIVGEENAVTVDGYASPEDVLFAYNEHKKGGRLDQRVSTRLLYGTTVAMRPEGYEADDFGFTYNVSANGLYVRTLAVPEQSVIWLELLPPRTERRVRLVGEVAWRSHFQPTAQSTVPPGFGLRIIDGARRDLAAWSQGCASFELAFS